MVSMFRCAHKPDAARAAAQSLEATIEARDVKLVVIDSIAALLRLDYQGRELVAERQELLGRQAAALKFLAEKHNIPVLVTNQVRAGAWRGVVRAELQSLIGE
jgi:DNA repair protein RadA